MPSGMGWGPMVAYLSYALMMAAHLPPDDPVRARAERALLRRLEAELAKERRLVTGTASWSAAALS